MRVLQFAKHSLVMLAAAAVALTGCGSESAPMVPFNPSGATADMDAVNTAFASPAFSAFSTLSVMFDAALGGAPLVSGSAAALDLRGVQQLQMAAARSAQRIAQMVTPPTGSSVGIASAVIPSQFLGKTFVYSGGSYVVSAETGAPANGVRFLLYAIDPVTLLPAEPLNNTGYVDLVDMSSSLTSSARVIVVSGTTTYLDYRVNVSSTATSGLVTVAGYITDGSTQATFNLRSTLTLSGGLSLTYSLDVPQRDLSIDLTLAASGTTPETSTIGVTLDMRGQNGWVRLTGQLTSAGGTLNVAINGTPFATITSTTTGTSIAGADGQPLAPDELDTLQRVMEFIGGAFVAFDQLITPVGMFVSGVV